MNPRCHPRFASLLEQFAPADIDGSHDVVFGMWPDFRLAYFNQGWVAFAQANGAPPLLTSPDYLGVSVLDICGEALRPMYETWFSAGLATGRDQLHRPQRQYECSSTIAYRNFAMTLYPLGDGQGLLAVNTLIHQGPHGEQKGPAFAPDPTLYRDANGIVRQCSHCRKVQRAAAEDRWDWVPSWVDASPTRTSHGMCPLCFDFYFPG